MINQSSGYVRPEIVTDCSDGNSLYFLQVDSALDLQIQTRTQITATSLSTMKTVNSRLIFFQCALTEFFNFAMSIFPD